MKLIKIRYCFIVLMIVCSCRLSCTCSTKEAGTCGNQTIDEVFEESNRPTLEFFKDPLTGADDVSNKDYFFVKPWNYEKEYNASRVYPLLIYLHGSSQTRYLKNLYYMGMGYYPNPESKLMQDFIYEYQKDIADEFRKTYPCFMVVPQGLSGWDSTILINLIESLKAAYRIDSNRMYIHGYSMGGWGANRLANDYYNYNKSLFAGIILLAGCYNANFEDEVIAKSSIWLHIGLLDDYTNTRNTYTLLKIHALNAGAKETAKLDYSVSGHRANAVVMLKDGVEIALKTEYPYDGHGLTGFPFEDPDVMEWLFCQSLSNR
jgi:predicted peptidase